jgi:secreted protein with Ig-like and vWFA domain
MPMKLECTVNPYIPVTHQPHLVYALVEITPTGDQKAPTAPLNVGLVVDVSESMTIPILSEAQFQALQDQGMAMEKSVDGVKVWQFNVPRGFKIEAPSNLDFTQKALAIVADMLRAEDRFSLVAFAEDALLLVHNTPGQERNKLVEAIDRLGRIDLGDETYMARGMDIGYQQILAGASADAVSRMVVLTDGYTKDQNLCDAMAVKAKNEGLTISTMGLGLDFNEDLLISLAESTGGNAYFVQESAELLDVFQAELSSAQSVTWRQLGLSLTLPTDATLRRVHRVTPTIAHIAANADAIELGDLGASQPLSLLLELILPPRPAGTYRLAQATLYGRSPTGKRQQLDQRDILVQYSEKPSEAKQTDPTLMSAVQRVSAFKLQNQALQEASRGNVAGATRRLQTAGQRLIEMGHQDLGQTMLSEVERMKKEGHISDAGTKKLRYGTRKLK